MFPGEIHENKSHYLTNLAPNLLMRIAIKPGQRSVNPFAPARREGVSREPAPPARSGTTGHELPPQPRPSSRATGTLHRLQTRAQSVTHLPVKNAQRRTRVCWTAWLLLFGTTGRAVDSPLPLPPAHLSHLAHPLHRRIYSCSFCRNHNAYHDDIISKARPD